MHTNRKHSVIGIAGRESRKRVNEILVNIHAFSSFFLHALRYKLTITQ